MSLPNGYTTTTAAGILVLWRATPDGAYSCVTVLAESVAAETITAIANRDVTLRRPISEVEVKHPQRRIRRPPAKAHMHKRSSVTQAERPVAAP